MNHEAANSRFDARNLTVGGYRAPSNRSIVLHRVAIAVHPCGGRLQPTALIRKTTPFPLVSRLRHSSSALATFP